MNTPLTPNGDMQNGQINLPLFRDFDGDEVGGRHAIRGFTFQVWQAVLETLKAHASGEDYAIVLEWQQDIAVLNSSKAPTQVTFVQLKKNEASLHWTFPSLIKAEADAEAAKPLEQKKAKKCKPSILAKLYAHRIRFKGCEKSELVFASNAKFHVEFDGELSGRAVDSTQLLDISRSNLTKLSDEIRKQLALPQDEVIDLTDFSLMVTNCPPEEGYKYLIGELAELCTLKKIQPNVVSPFNAIVLIASYVQLRSGKIKHAKNFDQLLERSITRTEVDSYFVAANNNAVTGQQSIDSFLQRLNSEVASYHVVKEMRKNITQVCADVTNRTSFALQFIAVLREIYHRNNEYAEECLQKDVIVVWLTEFKEQNAVGAHLYSDEYIYCLMAMIIENANSIQYLPPVSISSKSEDEK